MAMTTVMPPATHPLLVITIAGTAMILMARMRTILVKVMGYPMVIVRTMVMAKLRLATSAVAVTAAIVVGVILGGVVTGAATAAAKGTIRRTSCKFNIEDHLQQRY
jgi:hypothetical protein